MRNRQALPRYINPASVQIGDLIRVSWNVGDLTHTRQGRVARREYEGGYRIISTTGDEEIFRWHPAYDKQVRVTLIEQAPYQQAAMDFSSILDDVKERVGK